MGRVVKFILSLLVGFAALFILASIALFLFFDPNDFREDISKTVKSQTGRDLIIEGDISLDVFPWLAVEVGKASLGNAPGFGNEPMASFERASFSVRLLPVILRHTGDPRPWRNWAARSCCAAWAWITRPIWADAGSM